jgi:formylglycine-generating enzyme required for sulfatase activity
MMSRSLWKYAMRRLLVLAALLFALPAHAVSIDWVTVGDPGNKKDTTSHGAVADVYRIGKYEVTNAQYAEFLNAVAETDTYGLYNPNMADPLDPNIGGITRAGSPGSYTYSAIAGREAMPVNWVSFWDALRFANWLHNGQPTGAQGSGTTETGAYTITAQGIADNSIARNADATIFLTNKDEWYKAAYYDASTLSYNHYPFAEGLPRWNLTACEAPPGTTSYSANCDNAVGDLTAVGAYSGSSSEYDTFDQGGNVSEWTEQILDDSLRGLWGGSFGSNPWQLNKKNYGVGYFIPSREWRSVGFRVATIPELLIAVDIDIRPWSDENSIDPMSRRLIPVALLGSDTFDVADVDVATLAFGPDPAEPALDLTHPVVYWLSHWDVNRDGEKDLLSFYRTEQTGIAFGDTEACLTGKTLDGAPFEGCDAVSTTPGCGLGTELVLLLPPLMWLWRRRRS